MSKNSKKAKELSTPLNVESQIIVTSDNNTEVTHNTEFEIMPDSQETTLQAETPAEVPAEPAQVETIDNTAMINFMKEVKEQQAEMEQRFNDKLAEVQNQNEAFLAENEALKAKLNKPFDEDELKQRIKTIEVCKSRIDYVKEKLNCITHRLKMPEHTTIYFGDPETESDFVEIKNGEIAQATLAFMHGKMLEIIKDYETKIENLKHLNQ